MQVRFVLDYCYCTSGILRPTVNGAVHYASWCELLVLLQMEVWNTHPGRCLAHPSHESEGSAAHPAHRLRRLAGAGVREERRAHNCESLASLCIIVRARQTVSRGQPLQRLQGMAAVRTIRARRMSRRPSLHSFLCIAEGISQLELQQLPGSMVNWEQVGGRLSATYKNSVYWTK
jgi:hypothetical protein